VSGSGDIAGCILAGGQSRRMGEDKAGLLLGGAALIDLAIARLKPQVATLIVNRHDEATSLEVPGYKVVTDAPGDHQGPLAGILAALVWARQNRIEWVATVAVDTPFFPRDLVRKLSQAARDKDMAVARSGARLHPVFGLWKSTLASALADYMKDSRRSVQHWVLAHEAGIAEWPKEPYDPFFNLNEAADVNTALRIQAEYRP